jgi:pimeloyl-ACP methyl ester carboxylesterase
MSEETMTRFGEAETPDWSDREAVIGYGTQLARVSAATSKPFDESGMHELWGRVFDRTANIESTFVNHDPVVATEPVRKRPIDVPTLVIHGDEDPVVRLEHGEALAREVPGSRLIVLPGVGHELPPRTWGVVVRAIAEHSAAR